MVGSILRFAAAAAFCTLLADCAGGPQTAYDGSNPAGTLVAPGTPLQCVPYARAHSEVALYGDAYTWWDQATGRYARSSTPAEGSVLVLNGYAGPNRAHLAVVRSIVGPREIHIDHANWMDDGAIYLDDPVRDVSPANDWSAVIVYNIPAGSWGTKVYPVQGFILPLPPNGRLLPARPDAPDNSDAIARLLNSLPPEGDSAPDEEDSPSDGPEPSPPVANH